MFQKKPSLFFIKTSVGIVITLSMYVSLQIFRTSSLSGLSNLPVLSGLSNLPRSARSIANSKGSTLNESSVSKIRTGSFEFDRFELNLSIVMHENMSTEKELRSWNTSNQRITSLSEAQESFSAPSLSLATKNAKPAYHTRPVSFKY
jgi:hypothetical protein